MAIPRMDRLARSGGQLITTGGAVVARRAYVADRLISRAVGMLGTPDPAQDEALVLVPCAAVHALGMRAPIGAAFVDRAGAVMRVVDPLPRWGAGCRGAHAVIEASSGMLALAPGDVVRLTGATIFPHGGTFGSRERGSIRAARALSGHREHAAPPK